jgi:hypothetical protein
MIITDCHNDRVLVVAKNGMIRTAVPSPAYTGEPLFDWPRFAVAVGDDFLVADGRQQRVVRVSRTGRIKWALHGYRSLEAGAGWKRFRDPHHVVVLDEDPLSLLVTDSDRGAVVRVSEDGVADWRYTALADPHMAAPLADGSVLICDTGTDRVLGVSAAGELTWQVTAAMVEKHTGMPMRKPRAALRTKSGDTIVADTANHRLLVIDVNGSVRSLEARTTELVGSLFFPRYIALDHAERVLVITDFDNSRVIAVRVETLLG